MRKKKPGRPLGSKNKARRASQPTLASTKDDLAKIEDNTLVLRVLALPDARRRRVLQLMGIFDK